MEAEVDRAREREPQQAGARRGAYRPAEGPDRGGEATCRRCQHERPRPGRIGEAQLDRDLPAERIPHHHCLANSEFTPQAADHAGVEVDRVGRVGFRRLPVAGEVGRDHAPAVGERGNRMLPVRVRGAEAVQQDEAASSTRLGKVDADPVDLDVALDHGRRRIAAV